MKDDGESVVQLLLLLLWSVTWARERRPNEITDRVHVDLGHSGLVPLLCVLLTYFPLEGFN